MTKIILIVVLLLISSGSFYYYLSTQEPLPVEYKGDQGLDTTKAVISLATTIVTFLGAVATLILKIMEIKAKKQSGK
ncbi:MAG: hypothetical protein MUC94_15510 [bacterium]|jgi:NADH:ubiquinone oxidoreductase subunit 2 (subunit N)|nr:hypothetical protein [bacterium]